MPGAGLMETAQRGADRMPQLRFRAQAVPQQIIPRAAPGDVFRDQVATIARAGTARLGRHRARHRQMQASQCMQQAPLTDRTAALHPRPHVDIGEQTRNHTAAPVMTQDQIVFCQAEKMCLAAPGTGAGE